MRNIAKLNKTYGEQNFFFVKFKSYVLWNVRALLLWLAMVNITSSNHEFGSHIRECCKDGIQHAANHSKCGKYVHGIVSLSPVWRGLCQSAHSVCCSTKLEEQYCVSGQSAAVQGSKCDGFHYNPSYINCCHVCQIGLAVKASNIDCSNIIFSFFNQIKSYNICCSGIGSDTLNAVPNINLNIFKGEIDVPGEMLFGNVNDGAIINSTHGDKQAPDRDKNKKADSTTYPKNEKNFDPFQCSYGYRIENRTKKCTDIDECATNLDECQSGQYCHNTIGSYRCLQVNSTICDPSNENCYRECFPGFQYINGSCVDIDECNHDVYACDSNQVCFNEIGGYRCDCKIGFSLDTTTNACVDINECSINNHNCLPTQRCDNTYGSYVCIRLQSCGTGYTLNAETGNCDDDDECTLGTHSCPNGYACYNTKGSFRCHRRLLPAAQLTDTQRIFTAIPPTTVTTPPANLSSSSWSYVMSYNNQNKFPPHSLNNLQENITRTIDKKVLQSCEVGYRRNHLDLCVDFNECTNPNSCGSHQRCVNTNGSYRCRSLLQCSKGYQLSSDGTQCIDVDECKIGEHQCVHNQICRNRNGGYICTCSPGYELSHTTNGIDHCIDINECKQQEQSPACPTNSKCFNTIGSYYCECISGFRKSEVNEKICLDVNECQDISGLCQQKCVNYWGGYRCTCNDGYEVSTDNRTCNDVNECEMHKAYKLCMGYCENVPGSYECSCPRGYTLGVDKTICRDIDECATGEFCTGQTDICTNIHGSYKCTPMQCEYGYIIDPDQKNRCRLTSNFCEGKACYSIPFAYTYNFITLISKLGIPPEGRIIFSLRGPMWYNKIDFDWKITKIQAAANIEEATEKHFGTINDKQEFHLQLKRTIEGPQEVEIEITMTVFTNGMPRGKSVAKIFILVSQYTF